MHVLELERIIERELSEAIQSHFPLDWGEDPITHEFAIRLRRYFKDTEVRGLSLPLRL